ncbi:MAG TPA: TIGR01777 family oxidoreductase [Vicinamibacterales bacterium]|jgi:uncharacterized protein (TIGR01777 family)|nr:TIGR01777 family oxidoreductase [Vicinamibacterales bacterium]
MRIIIAGGRGFLGSALTGQLTTEGHDVVVLTRPPAGGSSRHAAPPGRVTYAPWNPDGQSGGWAQALHAADAVVNLAGESIAGKRWTAAQKEQIRTSRLMATGSLVAAIREMATPPRVFVSGSAVGYYGDRGDETLTEASAPGQDFLAGVCKEWESTASAAASLTRVALVRTGIVLDRRGGALPKMLTPFLVFAGGPIGSGRQYRPWIHREDWTRLVSWIIQNEAARGPLNATAPTPVTDSEFAKALGHALHRPSFMPTPGFALKIMLGEMAGALLLSGQRALPVGAADLGFSFRFANLDEALADIFKRGVH